MASTELPGKLRIAVIGAGIGGLTFASTLRHVNSVEIDLYEAAPQISEIGAGISIWRRTWAALREIGLEESLCEALSYRPSDEPKTVFEYHKGHEPAGGFVVRAVVKGGIASFHRPTLQRVLTDSFSGSKSIKIHFAHRLVSFTEDPNEISLTFENGETAKCDLLIGADGIRSVVRKAKHEQFGRNVAEPVWLGRFCYRALVGADVLREVAPEHPALNTALMYVGKNAHVVCYPISNNTLVNVVAFSSIPGKEGTTLDEPPFREATREEMLAYFTGWNPEVLALLNCVDKPLRWAIQGLNPLDTYSAGRIALVGDSAHCMAPHLGGGAGQAMEDAWILGTLISSIPCAKENVPDVLRRYSEIRTPYGNKILRDSIWQGKLHELSTPEYEGKEHLSDEEYERLGESIRLGQTWGEDPAPLLAEGQRARRLDD